MRSTDTLCTIGTKTLGTAVTWKRFIEVSQKLNVALGVVDILLFMYT